MIRTSIVSLHSRARALEHDATRLMGAASRAKGPCLVAALTIGMLLAGGTAFAAPRAPTDSPRDTQPIAPVTSSAAERAARPLILLPTLMPQEGLETTVVLGQRIRFRNPPGYCTVGDSPREKRLFELTSRALGPGIRLVHYAVRCSELTELREGRSRTFKHWLGIQLLRVNDDFEPINLSREKFLKAVAKAEPRVDTAQLNRHLQDALQRSDLSISDTEAIPLGRDANVVYRALHMRASAGATTQRATGILGITLLNSLPLQVLVFEATGSQEDRAQLQPDLAYILRSLLLEN